MLKIHAGPVIPEVVRVGEVLKAIDKGHWTPTVAVASYQWFRCSTAGCVPIDGATDPDGYTVQAVDLDHQFFLRLTVSLFPFEPVPVSADSNLTRPVPRPPSNTRLPEVTGAVREGRVVSASPGGWSGTPPLSFAYQWQRCSASGQACNPIAGAVGATYRLTSNDVGQTVRVVVTASNLGGDVSAPSRPIGPVARARPENLEPPAITGVAEVQRSLTATPGRWLAGGPIRFVYRWRRCEPDGSDCARIRGRIGARYEVRPADIGYRLGVRVTAISDAGSSTRRSALTAVVPAPALMRPFPVVRIKGYITRSGAVLELVTVKGQAGARISIACRGRDCPFRRRTRTARSRVRLNSLEQRYRAGTRLTIRVTKRALVGKHTRIVIRAGRPPARRDRCLMPGGKRPFTCPP